MICSARWSSSRRARFKKNDYCKDELQENEMDTMKTEDLRDDLNAKIGSLESQITALTKEIADAKVAINQAQVDLQRGGQDRQVENLDFQKTIADQTVTIEVLHKAMELSSNRMHYSLVTSSAF